jgi:hemerythrin
MKNFQWHPSLSVQIKEIDDQHKHMITIINTLQEHVSKGDDKNLLKNIFNSLSDYAVEHFFTEEKYMFIYGYPRYEEHKKEHQKFKQDIKELQEDFESGEKQITTKLIDYLKNWLHNHISDEDQKYAPYLSSRVKK